MKSSFKTALIAAVVSAFVAAGAAVATTQTFQLGTSNAPDGQTPVVAKNVDGLGGINAPMFKFTNASTGGSATPLALNAGTGRPPLAVSNKVKVANLNADYLDGFDSGYFLPKTGTAANAAKLDGRLPSYYLPATGKAADSDKLDGIDSTSFMQGQGSSDSGELDLQATAQHPEYALLGVPHLGGFSAYCYSSAGVPNQGTLTYTNNTAAAINMTSQGARTTNTGTFYPWAVADSLSPGATYPEYVSNYVAYSGSQETWQFSPASGGPPIATVVTSIMFSPGGCVFRASYVENG